jgi:hypothetical protein
MRGGDFGRRFAGIMNKMIDCCFFASMPHLNEAPRRALLFHLFLPRGSATIRYRFVTIGYK